MATKKATLGPATRLEIGAVVLTANLVDTSRVKARLERFGNAQRRYATAQRKVEAVETSAPLVTL